MIRAAAPPLLAAVAALVASLVTLLGPAPASAAEATTGLSVEITRVTPAVVPRKGPIVIAGIVRNDSAEPWRDIRAYPLTSRAPMTTREAVSDAALTDPDTYLGERLVEHGQLLGDLDPGASSTFRIRVPRAALDITGAPGVYWLGVHVLGTDSAGHDSFADGRARTFLPLIGDSLGRGDRARVALLVPIREPVRRARDGSISRAARLARTLAPGGRLGRLLTWAERSGTQSLTLLVDPAVLDAARAIAEGNPALALGPAPEPDQETPEPSTGTNADARAPQLTDLDQAAAEDWLNRFTVLARHTQVLALPYADPDVSALASSPRLLTRARDLATEALADHDITATPAVAPTDGRLDPRVLDDLPPETTVVLDDAAVGGRGGVLRLPDGGRLVLTDSATSSGGPLPEPRRTVLPLRQRLLADAALSALEHRRRPVVVSLPDDWDPQVDASAGRAYRPAPFFRVLDRPWLRTIDLRQGRPVAKTPRLRYPAEAAAAEVPAFNLSVAGALVRLGRAMGDLVVEEDSRLDHVLSGAGLGAVSYAARRAPAQARRPAAALEGRIRSLSAEVSVVGNQFVLLSGGSGRLTVSVVNGLNEPVSFRLRARTGNSQVRITGPKKVDLGPGQRSTVRLFAEAGAIGVHDVTLTPVTANGDAVGTPLRFSLRTSAVGKIFWGVLGVATAALFWLVARRIRQRLRAGGRAR